MDGERKGNEGDEEDEDKEDVEDEDEENEESKLKWKSRILPNCLFNCMPLLFNIRRFLIVSDSFDPRGENRSTPLTWAAVELVSANYRTRRTKLTPEMDSLVNFESDGMIVVQFWASTTFWTSCMAATTAVQRHSGGGDTPAGPKRQNHLLFVWIVEL
ncbi:hypothetical protein JCGZ_08942 [Jatropha curcas]|uniref:Uncharacterized protein n=1 Tax=Jatropha curcas TaxID=180498 RepID=A0A067KUH0_JATCU|nr:hypothetical protein JCGZ_08942 [Jatropha curcas]